MASTRLIAHVGPDGSIETLVAMPEGDVQAMVLPRPGVVVCEISDHDLGTSIDPERLAKMRDEYVVTVKEASGTLKRRKPDKAD